MWDYMVLTLYNYSTWNHIHLYDIYNYYHFVFDANSQVLSLYTINFFH